MFNVQEYAILMMNKFYIKSEFLEDVKGANSLFIYCLSFVVWYKQSCYFVVFWGFNNLALIIRDICCQNASKISFLFKKMSPNMESNRPTILVLLEFSKALYSVCHGLFILKLRQRHLSLLVFFLGIKISSLAPLVAGVPQGSSILPLCFSLFIDAMTEVLEFSKYHMLTICRFIIAGREKCF
jgi:hypothetical protein